MNHASLDTLKGVGPRVAERLARLQLHRVEDLLFHLPLRYRDYTRIVPLGALAPGVEAAVEGRVALADVTQRGRRALLCRLTDNTGQLTLRFFHFSVAQQRRLVPGTALRCFGEVRPGVPTLEMIHPEVQFLDPDTPKPLPDHLTPIYPTTEGLGQYALRSLVAQALDRFAHQPPVDYLPGATVERLGLPSLAEALTLIHRPPATLAPEDLTAHRSPPRRRLAFEELVAHHLSLRQLRARAQATAAPPLTDDRLAKAFVEGLPFALTSAQTRVIDEVKADVATGRPMLRLVQGDVGSGKTVVAAACALLAVASGCQAAIMAPTELLAEQHHSSFSGWLAPLGIEVAWLTGRLKAKARARALDKVKSGEASVVVGTHALFQEAVAFQRLGLVVVDEQHRFGVHQRLSLRDKGRSDDQRPHQLIMTATPIPRTLAMSAYADLDTSVIDELPPGRQPITTVAIAEGRRDEVLARIRQACRSGRQAYWVCPLIEESEQLQCQAATDTAAHLTEQLSELRIGLIHGRLKPADKEAIMGQFKGGQLDLLVATTVIEVGVDVPNASLMIIENAERLGLAQLHQLRGRVGRGSAKSSCVLLYKRPLSQAARTRLDTLRRSNDGFVIAEQDLALRGPGEVLGTRQTGMVGLRIADLLRDEDLLPVVRQVADAALGDPAAAQGLVRRWVGEGTRYGEV